MTPNFSLAEFTKSQTALRRGIDNTPPEHVEARLKILAQKVLEPVRKHFGKPVRISSGYRCLKLNNKIGGSENSQHIHGWAADFEIPGVANMEICKFVRDNLEYDQLIGEYIQIDDPSAGWVHVSYREGKNRNMVLTIGTKDKL